MLYTEYLKRVEGCPFCDGDNATVIEGEYSYLTYALAPYHKHHMLVVPKRHVESIEELLVEELAEVNDLQYKGLAILKRLEYTSASLLVREGSNKARSVGHTHFHVIPQVRIGNLDHELDQQTRKILEPHEALEIVEELKKMV